MKLFYSAGSCSTSCHIALEEAGLPYSAVQVDWDTNTNTAELEKISPLGVVPVLVTDNGKTLTQNVAILEYIADSKPSSQLLPAAGTWDRAQTMSWLSFVASDLHKAYGPLFALETIGSSDQTKNDVRNWTVKNIKKYLGHIDENLVGKDYLTGKTFTAADAYLFVVVGWSKWVGLTTDEFKNLNAFMARVYQRPAVQKVMREEGLLD